MKGLMARMRFNFPIRFKFMITQLLVVTTAVGVITFTMAKLFHTDKTAYVHDLTSVIAVHTAEETHALLGSYQEKLQVFARLMAEEGIPPDRKSDMLKKLFQDFQEFVMISEYEGDKEKNTVYDAKALEAGGLTKADLVTYQRAHPLPLERIRKGEVFIENSTVSTKLPTMTLAVAEPAAEGVLPNVITAVVRLDALIKLAGRSRVFESFIIDKNGTLIGHSDPRKVASHLKPTGLPALKELNQAGSLGTTVEYTQNGLEMVGGFAGVEFGGVLTCVQIPKATAYLTARTLLNSLLGVALLLLMASALLSYFWSNRLTRPIEKLSDAAQVVGRGNFDIQVESESQDEIGTLARSFNQMASELKTRETALKTAQVQLIQSEKMAAFGQLGAGIAHEVKNPLAGILGYAQLTMRKLEDGTPLHNNLKIIEKETKRCKTIIDNLMKFARLEKVSHMPLDINVMINDAVAIVNHQLTIHNVKLEKELAVSLPTINGNGNQIEQVLINLMINAQQAMGGNPGIVRLETCLVDPGHVEIRVKDTGPGMSKEIQAKIFEPFFTTKSAGNGTGLGLSVSYGIIKDHMGEIQLESEPGAGTEFIITLPITTPENEMEQVGATSNEV